LAKAESIAKVGSVQPEVHHTKARDRASGLVASFDG
jgi:hypothetical protein